MLVQTRSLLVVSHWRSLLWYTHTHTHSLSLSVCVCHHPFIHSFISLSLSVCVCVSVCELWDDGSTVSPTATHLYLSDTIRGSLRLLGWGARRLGIHVASMDATVLIQRGELNSYGCSLRTPSYPRVLFQATFGPYSRGLIGTGCLF